MSITLPIVDLSLASAGSTGVLDFSQAGNTSDPSLWKKPPSLILYNESGCGLNLTFLPSGNSSALPAGAWRQFKLSPGDNQIQYRVVYLIPSAQVASLMAEYFFHWEEVTPLGILGNSPMGISGVVNTSGSSTANPTIQESVKSGTTNSSGQSLSFIHGLSVTPDFVAVIGSNSSHKNHSVNNISSSSCDIYFAGGITINFLLYAIKIN